MHNSNIDEVTAQDIVKQTTEVAGMPTDDAKFDRWRRAIVQASAMTLVEATARLSSDPGKRTRDVKALREAIMAEIERKNSHAIIATMEKLDTSAARLTWVSLALAVVGVVLATLQVVQSLHKG